MNTPGLPDASRPEVLVRSRVFSTWREYRRLTSLLGGLFPELLAVGFDVCRFAVPRKVDEVQRRPHSGSRWLELKAYMSTCRLTTIDLPVCDVILFGSSRKPSVQPGTDLLAERLARRGYSCAVIDGLNSLTLWRTPKESGERVEQAVIDSFPDAMRSGVGRAESVCVALRTCSLWALLRIYSIAVGGGLRQVVLSNRYKIWTMLMASAHRRRVFARLLASARPRFVLVNNERVAPACELLMSASARSCKRVLFCNEIICEMLNPVLSDDVWVWNSVAERDLVSAVEGLRATVHQIGSVEAECVRIRQPVSPPAEKLRSQIGDRHVLVFLSQYPMYSFVDDLDTGIAERIVAEWLVCAAMACPEWHFVFKTRPYHHRAQPEWFALMESTSAITISRGDLEFSDLLQWSNVRVVGSLLSTGLYVAACEGRKALRFMVLPQQGSVPVVDSVSQQVHGVEELISALHACLAFPAEDRCTARSDEEGCHDLYPWLGRSVSRMEQLTMVAI